MRTSAGILLYRYQNNELEVFLVHPGGPFWKNKDSGAWSIPKGEFEAKDDALEAAKREFKEETGTEISGNFIALNPIKQKNNKMVYAWAVEGDIDADHIVSNTIWIKWPPRTEKMMEIPEVDRGGWFTTEVATIKIIAAQVPLIRQLKGLFPLRQAQGDNA
jgi:predicted NUDIX family NTP pyrophosphohydrolase